MTRLLLASASPARLATLHAAGIDPQVQVSGVDEDAVLRAARAALAPAPLTPADAVLVLARAKAEDVARVRAEAAGGARPADGASDLLLLGCDSMLELDGEVLGKPRDAADSVERWRAMRGRRGVLHTGHWLIDARAAGAASSDPTTEGRAHGATSSTVVHFADLSDAEIAAYVATGEPLAVAGAFTIDGLGGGFVTRIEGDHHGVVGLSLPLLRDLLGRVGLTLPDLWRSSLRR
ncbi:Maf family protein [Cellulomonas hominis]